MNATGQLVMRGEPLFDIYSPELYSAQKEYLLALDQATNAPGSNSLRTSALTKLKFFDISDEQISDLERTRQPSKTLRVNAPQDGFVMEKMVVQGQMVDAGRGGIVYQAREAQFLAASQDDVQTAQRRLAARNLTGSIRAVATLAASSSGSGQPRSVCSINKSVAPPATSSKAGALK